jgi:ureidoglycolate dehydrogenase (NAD+)
MSEQEIVKVPKDELKELIKIKMMRAGLPEEHSIVVADHLAYADAMGVHSHGAVRVEYYAERIAKGGSNASPNLSFRKVGPSAGIYEGDNAVGMVVALNAMNEAIKLAKETGIGIVGIRQSGHCGTLSYYLKEAVKHDMVALSLCQSDPMAVPYGGSSPYFGTNPIGFAAPRSNGSPIVIDMATTVQAWGKVLDARAKNVSIPDTWAVDENGKPTTDPFAVKSLLPIAGPKGYCLMMMVDILAGSLLGLPFGKHVSSMYSDLSEGRNLGQMHIVINPSYFTDLETFKDNLTTMVNELHDMPPSPDSDGVKYPGELSNGVEEDYSKNGVPIVKEIYDYLISDNIHFNRYDKGSPFASQ